MDNLSDDIIKYKKGELSSRQMHLLEKKALRDPFLAEALEGIENISSDDLNADVLSVSEKIRNRKKTILFTPLRIAAGIVLLVGSVFLVYQFIPKTETIALKTEKPKTENKITKDDKQSGGGEPGGTKEKEREKPNDDHKEKAIKNSEPLALSSSHQTPKAQQTESDSKNSVQEIQNPLQQAPVQDLASAEGQDVKIEVTESQPSKEISEREERGSGAKVISADRKKNSFAASQAQRSAMPNAEIKKTKSISGRVVLAEDGTSLPGVNVIIKGTSISTVTDLKGNYTLSTEINNQHLVFSFDGLLQQEVDVANQERLDIQMKEDASQPGEVIITEVDITAKDKTGQPVIRLAEPKGGKVAFNSYLKSNVKYPEEALINKIRGKTEIEFTIGTDGRLSNFKVIKRLGFGCDDEIIRLVKEGPGWSPSRDDNTPVESKAKVFYHFDPANTGK